MIVRIFFFLFKICTQWILNLLLLLLFPKHIFTEHLHVTHQTYRYEQYITNIKMLRILITITTTANMLVIDNNNNNDINNNIIIITI